MVDPLGPQPLRAAFAAADPRAHVDTSRTEEVTRGDFVTTQSYPVAPGDSLEVSLRVKWLA